MFLFQVGFKDVGFRTCPRWKNGVFPSLDLLNKIVTSFIASMYDKRSTAKYYGTVLFWNREGKGSFGNTMAQKGCQSRRYPPEDIWDYLPRALLYATFGNMWHAALRIRAICVPRCGVISWRNMDDTMIQMAPNDFSCLPTGAIGNPQWWS